MLAQQECALLLLIRSFSRLTSLGPALPAPSPPSPLPVTPPPCPSRQDSMGGGGLSIRLTSSPPRLPLASRAVYTALIGRPASTLPFTLAVVSIGGLRLRAGYINSNKNKLSKIYTVYLLFETHKNYLHAFRLFSISAMQISLSKKYQQITM